MESSSSSSFSQRGSPNGPRWLIVILVVATAGAALAWWSWPRLRLSEETVETTILTTLQQEVEQSFYVTGRLRLTVETAHRSTTRVLPGVLDLETGSTTVELRVPGHVSYGFDVRELGSEDIRLLPDGIVEVRLPDLSVDAVEPILEQAEIRTDVGGWERFDRDAERTTLRRALAQVRPALHEQAEHHMANSEQSRLNTARALRRLLSPPLEVAGLEAPRFRFVLAPGDTLELGDGERRRVVPVTPTH